jgi:hypothetical protein
MTLCVASQRVFIVVVLYFVIDSVRKLLDTPSYIRIVQNIIISKQHGNNNNASLPADVFSKSSTTNNEKFVLQGSAATYGCCCVVGQ